MDRVLFIRTLQAQRSKLLIVAVALGIWGVLMPLIYAQLIDTPLGARFKEMIDSGLFPAQFARFGGARRLGLLRPSGAGAGHHAWLRARLVLLPDPRLALAGCRAAAAVLALPLPRSGRDP